MFFLLIRVHYMSKETWKKIGKIAGDVLFAIVIIFILFIAITNLSAKNEKNGIPNIFGKGYLTVNSGSMDGNEKDSFSTNDLIVVNLVAKNKSIDVTNLKVGQIVTYYDGYEDKIISHRIVRITELNSYIVKGDACEDWDLTEVRFDEVIAVYDHQVKGLGKTMSWFGTPEGFFVVVVLPCILFLVYEVYKFVKVLLDYQKEKNSGDENEKKLAARKQALDDLVKDGVLTQEQADAKLAEYKASLEPVEVEAEEAPAE